jgi:hypothetical protein
MIGRAQAYMLDFAISIYVCLYLSLLECSNWQYQLDLFISSFLLDNEVEGHFELKISMSVTV